MPTLQLVIDARRAKAGADAYNRAAKSTVPASAAAGRGVDRVTRKMTNLKSTGMQLKRVMGGLFVGFTLFAAVRSMVSINAKFEETMAILRGVSNIVDKTDARFITLRETARTLGATTRFSAVEAAEGLLFLARAGFAVEEQIEAIPHVLNLATTAGMGLGQAADFASNILQAFRMEAGEMLRVVDALTIVANRSNTTVVQLAEAMKFAAPVAGALGISVEETAAAIGVLGDSGIQASMAGTNLRGIMAALLDVSTRGGQALSRMNLSLQQVSPTTENFAEIFQTFAENGLTATDAVQLFGRRNAAAALVLAASAGKIEELTEATAEYAGETERIAKLMEDTITGQWKAWISSLQEAALVSGDAGLTGSLKNLLSGLTSLTRVLAGVDGALGESSTTTRLWAAGLKGAAYGLTVYVAIVTLAKLQTIQFTLAIAANPIGIFAVALAALAAAVFFYRDSAEAAVQKTEAYNDSMAAAANSADQFADAQIKLNRALKTGNDLQAEGAMKTGISLSEANTDALQKERNALEQELKDFEGTRAKIDAAQAKFERDRNAAIALNANTLGRSGFGSAMLQRMDTRVPMPTPPAAFNEPGTGAEGMVARVQTMLEGVGATAVDVGNLMAENAPKDFGLAVLDAALESSAANTAKLRGELADFQTAVGDAKADVDAIADAIEAADKASLDYAKMMAGLNEQLFIQKNGLTDTEIAMRKAEQAVRVLSEAQREDFVDAETRIVNEAAYKKFVEDRVVVVRALVKELHDLSAAEKAAAEAAKELARQHRDASKAAADYRAFIAGLEEDVSFMESGMSSSEIAIQRQLNNTRVMLEKQRELFRDKDSQFVSGIDEVAFADHFTAEMERTEALIRRKQELQEQEAKTNKAAAEAADAIQGSFEDVLFGAESATEAVKNLGRELAKVAFRSAFNGAAGSLFTDLGASFAGMFTGGGAGTTAGAPTAGGAVAMGGVFSGGVRRFAQGGVLDGPTSFPMRGGMGLAGEAGPEAIMPLGRDGAGNLGVRGGVTVNMTVNTPNADSFRRSKQQITARLREGIG